MSAQMKMISDVELLAAVDLLAVRGARHERAVIEHLIEVENRELHLKMAEPSLFEFARKRLRASESTTYRRIRVARAARGFPAVLEFLGDGRLNLTVLALVVSALTGDGVEVLAGCVGLSTRGVEKKMAGQHPKAPTRDRIRHVVVEERAEPVVVTGGGELRLAREEGAPRATMRAQIRFEAGEGVVEKIERLRELMRHDFPEGRLEDIIEAACEALLDRKDPVRKAARKERRKAAMAGIATQRRPQPSQRPTKRSRYLPAPVRAQAFKSSGGACTYVGPTGARCGSRAFLEADHILPFAKGGANTSDNIRILCRAHNQYRAREA